MSEDHKKGFVKNLYIRTFVVIVFWVFLANDSHIVGLWEDGCVKLKDGFSKNT